MSYGAATCVAIVVILMKPPSRWLVRLRLGLGVSDATTRVRRIRRWSPAVLLLGLSIGVLSRGGALPHLVAAVTALGVVTVAVRLRLRAGEARRRRQRAQDVAEAIDALAAELGAGVLASHALEHLAQDTPLLGPAAAASRLGGDVAEALRTSARLPGAEALGDLAAAWEVSERSGAPMARVLDRLGDGLRDERDARREVEAGLGPAKATARLMAVLPLFGLGIGMNMGSNPVRVLLTTVPGSMCLALGAALACVGVSWVDRIAARAERA